MKKMISLRLTIILLLILSISANATIWYVHPDSLLNSIQVGIDSSSNGDTVLVAEGIYFENINFNGKDIVLGSFFLITDDTTYIYSTIIDGDSSGSVITFESGEDSTAVITGFTMQNGLRYSGGGIYCNNSSPNLRNVTISGNTASNYGGGIDCHNSSPSLTNVTVSGNTANIRGGGIHCDNSSPILTNVTISGNTAGWPAGGLGGGICCFLSNPSLTNVTINGNTATWDGGGIFCLDCSPNLCNVTVAENNADSSGGGIYCCDNSNPSLTNVIISGNIAGEAGGGIYCNYSNPSLVNCILWNDTPNEIDGDSVTVTYSCIQGRWPGTGNIDADPVFVSGPLSEYHLCPFTPSPCIDAGNPDAQYNDPEDPLIPGYAMWPALGTIRNDMGVYGGPGTEVWTGVEEEIYDEVVFTFSKAYPNPFVDKTQIEYNLPKISNVNIAVYNVLGARVKTLLNKRQNPGIYTTTWDGRDDLGNKLSSGFYFMRLEAGKYKGTSKLLLIR